VGSLKYSSVEVFDMLLPLEQRKSPACALSLSTIPVGRPCYPFVTILCSPYLCECVDDFNGVLAGATTLAAENNTGLHWPAESAGIKSRQQSGTGDR
jgi:hypothetical protein